MILTIPSKFKIILEKNDKLMSEILRLSTEFSEWVGDNKLEFFPEYTDHGIEHIQSVLNTAEEIISDLSWSIITPEDVYVLVSSILLHDSAMHLNKDGLWSLLTNDKFNGVVLGHQSDNNWLKRWEKFEKTVSRFEETDWNNFFGKFEIVELPKINTGNLNDYQRILIGDFIRQYHADIAQMIASHGIPTKDISYNIFNNEFTSLNEIAGFVARSHNYNLRDMVDEIGGEHKARDYGNTHSAFIMGVLRIADYLQFEQSRIPKILFRIKGKGMCSPISMMEWEKHLSILHTNTSHSDSELLFVETQPNDAKTLEEIKKLFKNFQSELDSFWAVNGEIYSRYPKLSSLGLNLRRIKSNIDNANAYVELNHKSFHPEVLTIQSDNQKILPLLVGPLYGDAPQIGLRELIQNSIDACNERYSIDTHKEVNKENIPYKVSVTLDFINNTLTIIDDGIGMDIEVVKNYFLKIGASYRYSEAWKATHSSDGNTYVPRTGKFGIGMLAGFLIGDEISVISKKDGAPDDKAIEFTYNLDIKNIQINFINISETGTKITIKSDNVKLEKIANGLNKVNEYHNTDRSSFWYFLDTPVINTKIIREDEEVIEPNYQIIQKEDIFSNWNQLKDSELQGYYWRIGSRYAYYGRGSLYCNGILVNGKEPPIIGIDAGLSIIAIYIRDICVFDNLGQFPLNLTRNDFVTKDFYEVGKLKNSVILYTFQVIKEIIKKFSWSQTNIIKACDEYSNLLTAYNTLPFIFLGNEILPISSSKLRDKYILFDFILAGQKRGVIYNNNFSSFKGIGYGCKFDSTKEVSTTKEIIAKYALNLKTEESRYYGYADFETMIDTELDIDGWVFIKTYDLNKVSKEDKKEFIKYGLTTTELNQDWSVISKEHNSKDIPAIGMEIINSKTLKSFIFVICKFNDSSATEFSYLWDKHITKK